MCFSTVVFVKAHSVKARCGIIGVAFENPSDKMKLDGHFKIDGVVNGKSNLSRLWETNTYIDATEYEDQERDDEPSLVYTGKGVLYIAWKDVFNIQRDCKL